MVIESSKFEYNTALNKYTSETAGGVIYATNNSVTEILNCSFRRNDASLVAGAIFYRGEKLVLKSSFFDHNTAINNCTAGTQGGAVFVAASYSSFEIQNCSFKGNKVTNAGGALNALSRIIIIKFSSFENNSVTSKCAGRQTGGAVGAGDNPTVSILNCSFQRNEAKHAGGAIYTYGKELIIRSSLFKDNIAVSQYRAKTFGGAICAAAQCSIGVPNSSFKANKAAYAGGAIFTLGKKLVIESSLLEYNSAVNKYAAKAFGGAVFAYNNSSVQIMNGSFNGNDAVYAGGAIYPLGKRLLVRFSSFQRNTAFNKRTAKSMGGAVCIYINSFVAVFNCSFNPKQAGLFRI